MAMTKIIDPRGWDFDRPIAVTVPISSRGLIGNDRTDFIKTAGHQFLKLIDEIKVAKDEVPVHLIALGASEGWAANRNGDGFKEATCRQYHDTFVKHARAYRDHANKNPEKSYGIVKASIYNDVMRRVELLTLLNATKTACERNGGLVADRELQKLAKGEDLAVSMACSVPFDICSGCKNKARTRAEYCTEKTCKYGGCANNLTKVAEDGHILHVDNPSPRFFDISHVFRPADRTAYGHRADWLQKAASHLFVPGAELAEQLGVTTPLSLHLSDELGHLSESCRGHVKLARGLAVLEADLDLPTQAYRAFDPAVAVEPSDAQLALLGRPGTEKAAAALTELADRKIILPLRTFARWLNKEASVDIAAQLLPSIYGYLTEYDALESAVMRNPFACATKTAAQAQRDLATQLYQTFSLDADPTQDRVLRSSLKTAAIPEMKATFQITKFASTDPDAAQLAKAYGLYKLAALHRIAAFDDDFMLTARLALGQNRI
jgi:hypothetical protein